MKKTQSSWNNGTQTRKRTAMTAQAVAVEYADLNLLNSPVSWFWSQWAAKKAVWTSWWTAQWNSEWNLWKLWRR